MSDEPSSPFTEGRSEPEKPILVKRMWRVRQPRSGKVW